jgi:hypothetical protein
LAAAGLGASVYAFPDTWETLADRYTGAAPLAIGLGPERERCVDIVTSSTGPEARILWEDIPGPHPGQLWTSLLALRTGRSFLGGLDPDVGIEHGHASFVDQKLAGRHILHWSDDQLEEFCRRYNVGWIVCWSEPTRGRIAAWKPKARPLPLPGNPGGFLFNLGRPAAFALEGTAQVVQADCQHITLADVVPDRHGSVVLSFHFQAGMQASPSRVHIERENDAFDPIPLIRLRMSGPVARVTLTWEGR